MPTTPPTPEQYAQLLALLWRHARTSSGRGPRRSLDIDTVVDAALRIADRDGLEGLSMRSVARGLGFSTMSLYTYVPDKSTLLALMADAVYLRMPRPPLQKLHWRDRLAVVADANLTLLADHPWLHSLVSTQPPLGPGVMAKYEHELSAFDDLGLTQVTIDDTLTLLLVFVQGVGRAATASEPARCFQSGLSDEQWWTTMEPLLAEVSDLSSFPRAARIGAAAGQAADNVDNFARAYRSGLACLAEGIAAVAARQVGDSNLGLDETDKRDCRHFA